MLPRIRRSIRDRALLAPAQRVLVACSGGGDSVSLLVALSRLGFEVHVVSVDHGLRPESAAEVDSVLALCERLGVCGHARSLELAAGPGVQARARAGRYALFHELAGELGIDRIALGHTRDDQAETVLARVLRGGGLRGMRGVRPRRTDGVVRPLIDCAREPLRAWLDALDIPYVDDPSNADERFERVRIRGLLRTLTAEDPRVVDHLAALADDAEAALNVIQQAASQISDPKSAPEAVRREWLRAEVGRETGVAPGRAQLEALSKMVRTGRGEVLLAQGVVARVDGEEIAYAPATGEQRSGDC